MSTKTPAQRHRVYVRYQTEVYRDTFIAAITELFAGGEVPGIDPVSPQKLRTFFESTDPQYWAQLMQSDPQEAMSQLQQWEKEYPGEAVAA